MRRQNKTKLIIFFTAAFGFLFGISQAFAQKPATQTRDAVLRQNLQKILDEGHENFNRRAGQFERSAKSR